MRTDEEIKKSIVSRMASDSRIDASDIKVKVNDGKVVITGSVPTYSNKMTAGDIAWYVAGVTEIDNKLKVQFPSTFTTPTDKQIKDSIEQLLKWNADVEENKVNVSVQGGTVTLEGSVPTYWQKIQAEKDAARAEGVTLVTNKLAVVPTEKISDEIVGERIMDRVEQNAPVYVDDVDVKVKNGRVTLTGTVPSYSIWSSIYDTTQNTLGVTDVNDNVVISYA